MNPDQRNQNPVGVLAVPASGGRLRARRPSRPILAPKRDNSAGSTVSAARSVRSTASEAATATP